VPCTPCVRANGKTVWARVHAIGLSTPLLRVMAKLKSDVTSWNHFIGKHDVIISHFGCHSFAPWTQQEQNGQCPLLCESILTSTLS